MLNFVLGLIVGAVVVAWIDHKTLRSAWKHVDELAKHVCDLVRQNYELTERLRRLNDEGEEWKHG